MPPSLYCVNESTTMDFNPPDTDPSTRIPVPVVVLLVMFCKYGLVQSATLLCKNVLPLGLNAIAAAGAT